MWKLVALLFAVACLAGLPRCFGQTVPVKNILVLHEGWEKFPVNALVNAEIQDVFSGDSTLEEQVFQEYMDDWRLEVSVEKRAEALHRKYWAKKLDLIIAVGSTPFQLLLSQGAKFFPGVPVLFMMVPDREIPAGGLPRNVTGVTMNPDFAGTVELALRLQPDTRNLVVVTGTADLDRFYANLARQEVSRFAGRLTIAYLAGLTPAALLNRLSQLPEHTVVLYVTLFQDGAGHSYVPSRLLPDQRIRQRTCLRVLPDLYGKRKSGRQHCERGQDRQASRGIGVAYLEGRRRAKPAFARGPAE